MAKRKKQNQGLVSEYQPAFSGGLGVKGNQEMEASSDFHGVFGAIGTNSDRVNAFSGTPTRRASSSARGGAKRGRKPASKPARAASKPKGRRGRPKGSKSQPRQEEAAGEQADTPIEEASQGG